MLLGLSTLSVHSQITNQQSSYYYAIENLDNGQVVRRGKTTQAGIPQGDLILAPDTRYREWLYQADAGLVGFADFRTPQSGQQFVIPRIGLGLPFSPDSDGDGLSDDAEFVVGTSISNPDSDGDGIKDGPAIALGLDPGAAARTGIVGSAAAPGTALDVFAFNDVAIVAESDRGVTVFNVFNRMSPLVIAQVDTPGSAQRVAGSGNLVSVADGVAGLAIIDITDPPAARIVHQVRLSGTAQAVASGGGIAYVGLSTSEIVAVDLAGGTVLHRVRLPAPILDLALEGDYLFALIPGGLHSISLKDGDLAPANSISAPSNSRRLTVGEGIAYVTYLQGYNSYNISNPEQPALLLSGGGGGVFWEQLVVNGSGALLANISAAATPDDVTLYDLVNPAQNAAFRTTFVTPGRAQAMAIFNGLAYIADGSAGLQVLNYLGFDTSNRPPAITLATSFSINNGTNGLAEEGKLVRVTARVSDDVQVRNVEFYVDGVKLATDGSFPFEHRFVTPTLARQRTFRLQARASDTGGNFTWSDSITVTLIPDATPPRVVQTFPLAGAIVGSVNQIAAYFNEPIAPATLNGATVQARSAGDNGSVGDPDDTVVANGIVVYREDLKAAFLRFPTNLPPGLFQGVIAPPITDLAANVMTQPYAWQFWILGGRDTDQDGIPDDIELALNLNPDNPDTDADGVLDGDEDFDQDQLPNKWEILFVYDPRNPDTDGNGTNDSQEDSDNDRLTNLQELALRTDPSKSDTDGDGWSDEAELSGQGNPLNRAIGPRLYTVASPPIHALVTGPGVFQQASLGTLVAQPPTTVLVPGLGELSAITLGMVVSVPPVTALVPGVGPLDAIRVGDVVAQPPLTVLAPGLVPFDAISIGIVVTQPPVTVLAPSQGPFDAFGLGTLIAQPPVAVLAPGIATLDAIQIGAVAAQPPVAVLVPGLGTGEALNLGPTLASPPVDIRINPQ